MVSGKEVVQAVWDRVAWDELRVDPKLTLRDQLLQEVGISSLIRPGHIITHGQLLGLRPLIKAVVQVHLADLSEVLAVDST